MVSALVSGWSGPGGLFLLICIYSVYTAETFCMEGASGHV